MLSVVSRIGTARGWISKPLGCCRWAAASQFQFCVSSVTMVETTRKDCTSDPVDQSVFAKILRGEIPSTKVRNGGIWIEILVRGPL